ncbi:unnamed protein product [Larinioides sclopetarius]|uniref:Uncharacterized protein n=1 Tax=Larinioides sclopetarius TaxID=280406 RepID=A0AAV2BTL3_9ARAC
MVNDTAIRRLVEMISAFYTEGRTVKEDLACSLTSEFLRNIQDVLFTKQIVLYSRFSKFFSDKREEMLSSPQMYVKYIFYACLQDDLIHRIVFEKFLNAFALILRIIIETSLKTKINFCRSVPDIFMVLFEEKFSKPFGSCKVFRRFLQYINNPRYLEAKCVERNISRSYDPNVSIERIPEILREKARQMLPYEQKPSISDFLESIIDHHSSSLANNVLEIIGTEFPLKKDVDLNASPSNLIQHKTTRIAESLTRLKMYEKIGDSKSTPEPCKSLNFDSKTSHDALGQISDKARYESIIEAVIRHNHSKSSCRMQLKGRNQTEADRILEHLKSTINSIVEVLDEYDKE